jgi:ParB family chromosome partitioning protein
MDPEVEKAKKSVLSTLFSDDEEESKAGAGEGGPAVRTALLVSMTPFPVQKFKMYEGDRLDDMVESIKEQGILQPLIVRPAKDGVHSWEILAGRNRREAGKLAGLVEGKDRLSYRCLEVPRFDAKNSFRDQF